MGRGTGSDWWFDIVPIVESLHQIVEVDAIVVKVEGKRGWSRERADLPRHLGSVIDASESEYSKVR